LLLFLKLLNEEIVMSDPLSLKSAFFPFNFAKGMGLVQWAVATISQNTALFSLLGTTYGGNGQSNFGLPDHARLRAMHPGKGLGFPA
jgi:microcystin-dependent protein